MQADLFSNAVQQIDLPNADIRYCSDFLSDHQQLYQQLQQQLHWQQDTIAMYGKQLAIPRLNCWYGDAQANYGYSGIALAPQPWTVLLQQLKTAVDNFIETTDLRYRAFNSVLGNYYRDQRDSVAWHSDDERELGEQPVIASLSFGESRRFSLKHKYDSTLKPVHLELAPGSLLIMAGQTQSHWQHQVPKSSRPCNGRINLTFRQVAATGVVQQGPHSVEGKDTVPGNVQGTVQSTVQRNSRDTGRGTAQDDQKYSARNNHQTSEFQTSIRPHRGNNGA